MVMSVAIYILNTASYIIYLELILNVVIYIIGVAIYIHHIVFLSLALIHIRLNYINLVMFIIVVVCVNIISRQPSRVPSAVKPSQVNPSSTIRVLAHFCLGRISSLHGTFVACRLSATSVGSCIFGSLAVG